VITRGNSTVTGVNFVDAFQHVFVVVCDTIASAHRRPYVWREAVLGRTDAFEPYGYFCKIEREREIHYSSKMTIEIHK
jgi:hypothetical protein